MTSVVIVESPAKCKTINKYLGKDYTVLASFGHIRDLPSKNGSVEPDNDFAMHYQISSGSTKHVKQITDAMKKADRLILATDPDREGEAISWHVLEMLKGKKLLKDKQVQRVSFNSITKKAILEAMENPRDIDMDLVNAQQARRALDYLVGFNLSPILWRKLPGSRSAGRVQSVALRMICEREGQIEAFKPQEYWSITTILQAQRQEFTAQLSHINGKKLDKLAIDNGDDAKKFATEIASANMKVENVESKVAKRNPYPPFTTSTLQQDASHKCGFSAKKTMMVAQKLYEGKDIGGETVGIITYMRTDAVNLAGEAIAQTRDIIAQDYGDKYLPKSPRMYKSKAKNTQEAHEAIRPTSLARRPKDIAQYLTDDEQKLYDLIYRRTMACQMEQAQINQMAIEVSAGDYLLRATGSSIKFDGYLKAYKDDATKGDNILPNFDIGQSVELAKSEEDNPLAKQHFTQPPARFNEASLVKRLEELGIGRPSTYATIISVLQDREYVKLEQRRFFPEVKGRLVTAFLEEYFPKYVEYDFTANLEDELDNISAGDINWQKAMADFWLNFKANVDAVGEIQPSDVTKALDERLTYLLFGEDVDRKCPKCGDGELHLKTGKFGAFLGCTNYPECGFTRQFGASNDNDSSEEMLDDSKVLGQMEGKDVVMKKGPYGWYVQLGEPEGEGKKKTKPKRQSLPKGTNPADMTLAKAEDLLRLPRVVGTHPETGKDIVANIGRFGPYVNHDGKFTSLKEDDVLTVSLERAKEVIAAGGKGKKAAGKVLGEHPKGGDITIQDGRYGAYVKYKRTNATIPKGTEMGDVTLEQAISLIDAKRKK